MRTVEIRGALGTSELLSSSTTLSICLVFFSTFFFPFVRLPARDTSRSGGTASRRGTATTWAVAASRCVSRPERAGENENSQKSRFSGLRWTTAAERDGERRESLFSLSLAAFYARAGRTQRLATGLESASREMNPSESCECARESEERAQSRPLERKENVKNRSSSTSFSFFLHFSHSLVLTFRRRSKTSTRPDLSPEKCRQRSPCPRLRMRQPPQPSAAPAVTSSTRTKPRR